MKVSSDQILLSPFLALCPSSSLLPPPLPLDLNLSDISAGWINKKGVLFSI